MIIIFLDIDGVLFDNPMDGSVHRRVDERLNRIRVEGEIPEPYPDIECDRAAVDLFDPTSLHYLHKLISDINEQTQEEVGIVLSSAWRERRSLKELRDLFEQHAFSKYLIDKTPKLSGQLRGKEIAQWLKEHKAHYDVSAFVILDDWDSGLSANFPEAFVEFNPSKLFTAQEHRKALDIVLRSNKS